MGRGHSLGVILSIFLIPFRWASLIVLHGYELLSCSTSYTIWLCIGFATAFRARHARWSTRLRFAEKDTHSTSPRVCERK